jgi:nucleotide-binding universal stress UspA family protein
MKIMVPVDGSEEALDAVRYALRLRDEGLQISLVLANVQEPMYLYEIVMARDAELLRRIGAEVSEHALGNAESLVKDSGIDYEMVAGTGDPSHTLVDLAEDYQCDMIVMGSRGLGRRASLLGSVSQGVLHSASLPVLVVRRPQPEAEEDEREAGEGGEA